MDTIFSGLALILVIGTAMALLMRTIGQPLLIGHILTGIIVGPALLHITKSPSTFAVFSDIGIALLLFIIGLGLNPQTIRDVGKTAATVGAIQVSIITIIGWLIIGPLIGLSGTASAFFGAALACSSTIIILKLLSDKKEQARLYGKIAISVSLVQDLFAIALVVVTSAGNGKSLAFGSLISLIFKGGFIGLAIYYISSRVLPRFQRQIADSQEFLFLFAIAWGLGIAALFAKAGLSSEIGALVAGIALAPLPYAQEIAARLRPLRDFFIIVFFITLGAAISFVSFGHLLPTILLGTLIVVVVKPLVSMAIMGFLGYTKRTSFKSAVALAQVSEFSIVLIVLARNRNLIDQSLVSAITFIALLTIAISTYLIVFSDKLYGMLEKYLDMFERRKLRHEPALPGRYEFILFGYQKGGHEFIKVFKQLGKNYVVVDYDPEMIDVLEHQRIPFLYGDANDAELLEEAGAGKAKLVVSTMTDFQTNLFLLSYLEHKNPEAVTIVEADSPEQAARLYQHGASYVILPHFIGSEQISAFVKRSGLKKSAFTKFREKHIEELEKQFGVIEKTAEHDKKLGQTIVESVTNLTKAKP